MVEILQRSPVAEDVEEILCGPRLETLPDDAAAQYRVLAQSRRNRLELIVMIELILSIKENDEREDQANG